MYLEGEKEQESERKKKAGDSGGKEGLTVQDRRWTAGSTAQ